MIKYVSDNSLIAFSYYLINKSSSQFLDLFDEFFDRLQDIVDNRFILQ